MTPQMTGLLTGATGLLIDGQWEPARTELAVLDKYTQQQIAALAVALASVAGLDEAINLRARR